MTKTLYSFYDIFSVFNFKNAVGTVPFNRKACSCLKRAMHKSVIICLNNFMKLTRHGDIQCISCSLTFSVRGYYLSHSISCSLSFLTKRENY